MVRSQARKTSSTARSSRGAFSVQPQRAGPELEITGPGQRGTLSSLLEEGKRAVTVRVDDVRGVAGFVLPGDFIDVVLIGEDPALPARELFRNPPAPREGAGGSINWPANGRSRRQLPKAVTVEVTA